MLLLPLRVRSSAVLHIASYFLLLNDRWHSTTLCRLVYSSLEYVAYALIVDSIPLGYYFVRRVA